jgi:hypothetical protein
VTIVGGLILGVGLLIGFLMIGQWFVQAKPIEVIRAAKIVAAIVLAGIAVLFLVSGRLSWALGPLILMLPTLLRARTLRKAFSAARGPKPGRQSRVTTKHLDMTLDHDTGEIDGTVTTGSQAGRSLNDLDRDTLIQLLADFADDPQSQQVLAAYLDRRYGAEWREATEDGGPSGEQAGDQAGNGGGGRRAGPQPGQMTRQEALAILGLSEGASVDEIKAAHRRLMKQFHPDQGGTAYFAAKINAAKERLLET